MNNDPYIYLRKHAIPDLLCEEIITFFENNKELQKHGSTIGGIHKNVKDTTDIYINLNDVKSYSTDIINLINVIHEELMYHLHEYYKNINMIFTNEYDKLHKTKLELSGFLIQKYEKGIGRYIYHNDFNIENNKPRMITFLFYLNDVRVGGETEFMSVNKIQPEQGSILLFPSTWTYHHCGNVPISDSKYIITGWMYADNTPTENKK